MPKIADAFVEIEARTGKYRADISKAKRSTSDFGKSATKSLKLITAGVAGLGVAAGVTATIIGVKLTKALIAAGKASVSTAIKYDKLERGLTAVVGSSEEAQRQLDRLAKVAELPGLSFEQAIQGSINLQAAGLSANLAERSLKAFGNALVTVGKGSADLAGVSLALTQIANKTSGFGQDVRQLQERLPQMQVALKNAFNGKPLEDLKITGKELVAALVTEFEKLKTAAGGPANEIENLMIAFDRLKAEVGKTLLGITSDTAKGIAGIIDKIRTIIPHWRLYQDQLVAIFKTISKIAIRSTGEMIKSMGKLIVAAAPFFWKPLLFGFNTTWTSIEDAALRGMARLLDKMAILTDKGYAKALESIERDTKKINDRIGKSFDESFGRSIDNFVRTADQELPKLEKTLQDLIEAGNAELDKLVAQIPDVKKVKVEVDIETDSVKRTGETEKVQEMNLKDIGDFNKKAEELYVKDLENFLESVQSKAAADREIAVEIFNFLEQLRLNAQEREKKAVKERLEKAKKESDEALQIIGDFNQKSEALAIKDAERILQSQQKNADMRLEVERQYFNLLEELRQDNLAKEQEAAQQRVDQVVEIGNLIKPAFEDLFVNILSGDTKNLWEQFWGDLKRIAIRQIADIAAELLVFNVLLGLPMAVNPAVAVGALAIGGGLLVGGALAGGGSSGQVATGNTTNNFYQTDFANLDQTRIQQTVSQAILPSLEEERTDGR